MAVKKSTDYLVNFRVEIDALKKDVQATTAILNKLRGSFGSYCKKCFHPEHWGYCWYNAMWINLRRHNGT